MTATPNLLAKCVALALSLCASLTWAGHDTAVALITTGPAIVGQTSAAAQRRESAELLKQARQAMKEGDYKTAEWHITRAEQLNVNYDGLLQRLSGDTPEKVRRDLAKRRSGKGEGAQPPSRRFPLPGFGKTASKPGSTTQDPFQKQVGLEDLPTSAKAQAIACLDKGRVALAQGNATSAVGWYHRALATGVAYGPGEYSPENLAAELRGAGIDATRLVQASGTAVGANLFTPQQVSALGDQIPPVMAAAAQPGTTMPRGQVIANPYAESSTPVANLLPGPGAGPVPHATTNSRRANVLRQLALSQAALNRGELDAAEQHARNAERLNLPETEFAPDDPRPWMVLLEIGRERRRHQVHVTPAAATALLTDLDSDTASGTVGASSMGLPQPASNSSLPRELEASPEPRMAQLIPAPAAATSESGTRLFQRGEEALKNRDLDQAKQFFREAWAHRDQLDEVTRQRLQDHLQIQGTAPRQFEPSPQSQLDATQRQLVQLMFNQIAREQAAINRQRTTDPKGAWERLRQLRQRVAVSDLDPVSRQQLMARVDKNIEEMEQFIERNRGRIEQDELNKQVLEELDRYRQHKQQTQQKLAEFVEQFNTLMEQQRYPEAVVVAKQARELDPLNPVVQNLVWKSQFARAFASTMARRERSHEGALASFDSVDDSAVPFDDRIAIEFPDAPVWSQLTDARRRLMEDNTSRYNEAEQEIQRSLNKQVDVNFENLPLAEVMASLSRMAGINYYLDPEGLRAEGVTSDTSVTIMLRNPVSLRSALNLILQPKRLSYIIQDEVLRITSEQERSGDVYQKIYNVADLVVPIPNFVPSYNMGLAGAIHEAHRSQGVGLMGGRVNQSPMAIVAGNNGGGAGQMDKSVLAQMGASGMLPSSGGRATQPIGYGPGGLGGGPQADFDSLIELITTTIDPDTWDEVGGDGSIASFETNLSLVISTTQETHEKIVDLLKQLRRLQDLQVTIEVRFITLTDNFFERIGVDFDFDIKDNTGLSTTDANIIAATDDGPSITVGLDPNGNFTSDLDLQFSQNSLGSTVPIFGGFDPGSAANFGFAILSDIEAYFVIQASQGDSRTNIMQAPKVTLFNGQSAFVSDSSQRPFVTSVIPVVGDFAAAHQPVITVLTEGTSLSVQAVVSEDRRFVRLTLVPFFSKIGDVDTFTFTGKTTSNSGTAAIDPADGTQAVANQEEVVTEGTTVQLPTLAFTSVNTTVSVPDGGTILLGGIKRLAEGRTEQGLPLMSKIPYVNRLFKNVGIGRETESLMMMVTPRIIIQEEEEERLGVGLPPGS